VNSPIIIGATNLGSMPAEVLHAQKVKNSLSDSAIIQVIQVYEAELVERQLDRQGYRLNKYQMEKIKRMLAGQNFE